jgi:hypothetical protein
MGRARQGSIFIPQGAQGTQGVQGDTGSQGPQGHQGYQGNQGVRGYQGYQGETGETGPQGVRGYQGHQGNQGEVGETGPQGDQGIQGATGATGATGDQGLQGHQGLKGDKGDTGSQGPRGYQGYQGHQGNQGESGDPPSDNSISYAKVGTDLKGRSTDNDGSWDFNANGILDAAFSSGTTSVSFSNLRQNKVLKVKLVITNSAEFTLPSYCTILEGSVEASGKNGTYYLYFDCWEDSSGNEEVLVSITKSA